MRGNMLFGFSLRQAEYGIAFFPLIFVLEHINALKTLQHVALGLYSAALTKAGVH